MSASKKYKTSETATEILHQQDTENINNRFRKSADFFGPSTSAAAAAQSNPASGARIALGQQNTNAMQRSGSNNNLNSGGTNVERRANFSMLDTTTNLNDHRSSTTTSAFFNKMGANNASKPGDVKKIVIKNFKGMFYKFFSIQKLLFLIRNSLR